jgi:hypothetical protein
MNRQKLLLIILAGLLVLALVYAFWASPRQTRVTEAGPRRPAAPGPEAVAKVSAPEDGNRVHLELLARENDASPDFKRNIFRFWQPPPPLPPPPPPPPAIPGGATPVVEEVKAELARFTFLGFLLKDGVRTIFLSSNEEIFVVKEGDRFGKNRRFLVTELTPAVLTIRQNDDPRLITVPLVEQAPLAEVSNMLPSQEPPSRSVSPFRRRSAPPARTDEVLEQTETEEPTIPVAPPEPAEPAEPAEPPKPAGEAVPVKDPFAVELTPPQGVVPNEVPND